MAVPRNRTSNAKRKSRRSHHALKMKHPIICKNCNGLRLPHTACISCGDYNGRTVLIQKKEGAD